MNEKDRKTIFDELREMIRTLEKNEKFTDYYRQTTDDIKFDICTNNTTEIYTYFNELSIVAINSVNEIVKKVGWEIQSIGATGDGLMYFTLRKIDQ